MFVEDFDHLMIDTLMVDRETKFNSMFKSELIQNNVITTPLGSDDDQTEAKVKRAKEALDDYDSDEERENANQMFVNDLQSLRKYFIKVITD